MIAKETYEIIRDNAERLNSAVIYDRDFIYVRPTRDPANYWLILSLEYTELLWLQDPRAILLASYQWQSR